MNTLEEVIIPQEAAAILGVHHRHVRRLITEGKLTARNAGGVWLILKSSVLAYDKNRR